jgi:glycosyltransferase involved in cell wall biosynthesis
VLATVGPVRWLAFGTYDVRAHPRVAVLLEGLAAHGEAVDEVVEPLGLSTADRVDLLGRPGRLPALAARIAVRWARLVVRAAPRLGTPYDAVLVGYLGHFDVLLARALLAATRARHPRRRRPVLVLDHLVSASATAQDRGLATDRGPKDRLLRALDAAAQRAADVVLVDTAERLPELTAPGRARAVVVPVGATAAWFAAARAIAEDEGPLRVVFAGLFTPLQGAVTIARAVAELGPALDDGRVRVTLAGTGQDHAAARQVVGDRDGVTWLDWVPAEQLPGLVAGHDVGLGIFGTTAKALTVVPTKVFQAAAAGCAVVTSDTAPQRDSLGQAAVFVPPGEPSALADALMALTYDRAWLRRLRASARAVAEAKYAAPAVVTPLLERLRTGPARIDS